jgi:hypothetical protein
MEQEKQMENEELKPSPLVPYEEAARRYCQLSALDPDHEMERPHPIILGQTLSVPFWHIVAEQMIDLSKMLVAMKECSPSRVIEAKKAGQH